MSISENSCKGPIVVTDKDAKMRGATAEQLRELRKTNPGLAKVVEEMKMAAPSFYNGNNHEH